MAKQRITAKQQEILDYIKSEILNRGFPPSVRQICDAVNLKSTSSVHAHLETLEKNGFIRRDAAHSRAIEIVDENDVGGTVVVDLIGFIYLDKVVIVKEKFLDRGVRVLIQRSGEGFGYSIGREAE